MPYAKDPGQAADLVWCSANVTPIASGLSAKLIDANRLDVGDYEHLVLSVINAGGTGGASIVPLISETKASADFPLDGTNGAPNYSHTFVNAADTGAKVVLIPVAALRYRYFNVRVTATAGTFRAMILLHGFGLRQSVTFPTAKAPLNIA